MTVLNFGQISVNISKTVQDRDIRSMKDSTENGITNFTSWYTDSLQYNSVTACVSMLNKTAQLV